MNNKKKYNPFLDEYFLGGLLDKKDGSNSLGGAAVSGAMGMGLQGAQMAGPWGALIGAGIGGIAGLIGGKQAQKKEAIQTQLELDETSRARLSNMNYGIGNGSNLPMAMGGQIDPISAQIPIGSYNHFPVGGTHESNPNGGIPQGINSQGQQMTTEEREGKFKFKDGDYIFSNRLIFE